MKLFLFPLGHVLLFPGTSKPLHIFEPRYLKMVRDAMSEKTPIAIGLVDDPDAKASMQLGEAPSFVRKVVGYGHPQIVEQRSDGSMLILLPGQGKARIEKMSDDSQPYIVVEAEPIPEDVSLSPEVSDSYILLQKLFLSWLHRNITDSSAREEFRRLRSPDQIVGCAAAYLVTDPDLQQMVLEANRLEDKIQLLQSILNSNLAQV